MKRSLLLVLCASLLLGVSFAGHPVLAEDIQGGQDHPMLNRMPGYQISEYIVRDFDAFEFYIKEGEQSAVEGKKTEIYYEIGDGRTPASEMQIVRNYINALKNIGGEAIYSKSNMATVKVVKGNLETWVGIDAYNSGDNYTLTIIEKQAMRQDIVADANSMGQSIRNTGKVSLYGIYFDSGKAEIKPESEAALKEIAKLLKQNSTLKLYVVGHTDNVGSLDANMKLSQARSQAVVQILVSRHGITADRLKGYGVASLSPVASNATPDGKAKNRRVELVEQ